MVENFLIGLCSPIVMQGWGQFVGIFFGAVLMGFCLLIIFCVFFRIAEKIINN